MWKATCRWRVRGMEGTDTVPVRWGQRSAVEAHRAATKQNEAALRTDVRALIKKVAERSKRGTDLCVQQDTSYLFVNTESLSRRFYKEQRGERNCMGSWGKKKTKNQKLVFLMWYKRYQQPGKGKEPWNVLCVLLWLHGGWGRGKKGMFHWIFFCSFSIFFVLLITY